MSSSKSSPKLSLREKLLSSKQKVLQEVSPISVKDIFRVKASREAKVDEDSKKRPRQEEEEPRKKPHFTPLSTMTDEQKRVLEAVKSGGNVFFTGSAGTGKSYLLRCILNSLPPDTTVATASTGSAACLINGVTLHSFAGIAAGDGTKERMLQLAGRPMIAQNWKRCRHLIIDEISMIDAGYFEKVEWIARQIRSSDKVFGGIQLIICGDFLQLPPVRKNDEKFCFTSRAWEECGFQTFYLKQVHRQTDPMFIEILNNVRLGIVSDSAESTLKKTASQVIEKDGVLATRLCCFTKEAGVINDSKLGQLTGTPRTFEAQDSSQTATRILDECTPVDRKLILKEGAQVMLLKNISLSSGLVNGARGVVQGFTNGEPVIKFISGLLHTVKPEKWTVKTGNGAVLTRTQLPLRLAWAFSIHKSQGLTLDCVEMCLSGTFEAGQAYVALSRAKNLDSLRIIGFQAKQVWAHPDVLRFYRNINTYVPEYIKLGVKKKSKSSITKKGVFNR